MTEAEREADAADPLWTNEGQVLWVLDELAPVSAIATELGCQPQVVGSALRKLADSEAVATRTVIGREFWGTAAQVHRIYEVMRQAESDRAEEARRIHERNRDLEAVRRRQPVPTSRPGRQIGATHSHRSSGTRSTDTARALPKTPSYAIRHGEPILKRSVTTRHCD